MKRTIVKNGKAGKTEKLPEQSESHLQQQCFRWMAYQYPKSVCFAVPNGGKRNIREAVKFKREGVKAGVADIILLQPNKTHHALCIELKAKSGKQSPEQIEFQKAVELQGYDYKIIRDFDSFEKLITEYLK